MLGSALLSYNYNIPLVAKEDVWNGVAYLLVGNQWNCGNPSLGVCQEFLMSSPKQRFQESKEGMVFWSELVAKSTFLRGLDMALLQLQNEMPDSDDPVTAAARFQRLNGAKRFRAILIDLAEVQKEKAPLPDLNLRQTK